MKRFQNYFHFEVADGYVSGRFNIYQALHGGIMLVLADSMVTLTYAQVKDLNIDVTRFDHYNEALFLDYYKEQIASGNFQ